MSTSATYATKITDKECLIGALKDVCGPSNVVATKDAVLSANYCGTRVIFSRQNENDTYDVIVSRDTNIIAGVIIPDVINGQTIYKLGQAYSKALVMKALRSIKGNVVKDEIDESGVNQIRIRTISFDE